MANKKWSELRPDTKRKYRAAGVSPAKYNAWNKKSAAQKRAATKTARDAGFSGTGREYYLGLRPHQISGASPMSRAVAAFKSAFGDRPKFRVAGVREYLARVKEEEGAERLRELAGQSEAELWAGVYPAVGKEESHHYR